VTVIIGKPISTVGRNSKELTDEVKAWIEKEVAAMDTASMTPPLK